MKPSSDYSTIEALAAVIAHSQIAIAQRRPMPSLPAGFDDSDIAVLDWIAAEGRRLGRSILRTWAGQFSPRERGAVRCHRADKELDRRSSSRLAFSILSNWFSLPPETRRKRLLSC